MTKAKIDAAIALGQAEIRRDVAASVVPASVSSFGELHDHVDANCYGGLTEPGWLEYNRDPVTGEETDWTDETTEAVNKVQGALHAFVVAGGHRLVAGR